MFNGTVILTPEALVFSITAYRTYLYATVRIQLQVSAFRFGGTMSELSFEISKLKAWHILAVNATHK